MDRDKGHGNSDGANIRSAGGSVASLVRTWSEGVRIGGPDVRDDLDRGTGALTDSDRICRVLNVVIAGTSLVLGAPLMLLIAAAIKLTSPGPVLFTQYRVGLDRRSARDDQKYAGRRSRDYGGRLFKMYKFRTMYHRDGDREQVWAQPDDPRITPVGRILRRFRLDELPQLFNVLKGDMNIVGPRPEQPEIFARLREEVDGYQRRQKVLPGITGWAQINHHYDQCVEDVRHKVELDLEYIERRSPLKDVKILALTVPVVVRQKGAI